MNTSKNKNIVTISIYGLIETHLPHPNGEYATLCSLDGDDDDPSVKQKIIQNQAHKITCRQCFLIWQVAKMYRATDFFEEVKEDKGGRLDLRI